MYEKGPVRVVEMFTAWCVRNTNGVVAQCPLTGLESGNEVAAANARRIAATWNACEEAGLSTEALESGVVREMVEALEALLPSIEDAVGEIYYWPEYERAKAVLAKVRGES